MYTLKEIAERIVTQDNRITSHPVFVVQSRRRIYGIDDNYTDSFIWLNRDGDDEEADQETARRLESAMWDGFGKDPTKGWERVGYIDIWINIQSFFTNLAAQEFIDNNQHTLHSPRIYVESGFRNLEWQAIRNFLIDLSKENK